jgi:two-component system OmpR family response regulator
MGGAVSARVLVIDDDARLFELLASYLAENGVKAIHAADGARGLAELEREAVDAVLLDVMMPGLNGLEVLRRVREKHDVPVIMLTAKGDETDRVVGLELGADDYLAKPFSPRELLARLRAVLRRTRPEAGSERLAARNVVVDVGARSTLVDGAPVELTGIEFDLLVALLRRPGRVVPRAALLDEAGRSDVSVGERTVDVHISNLRKKLGDRDRDPPLIRTVRGVGYVLAKDP